MAAYVHKMYLYVLFDYVQECENTLGVELRHLS